MNISTATHLLFLGFLTTITTACSNEEAKNPKNQVEDAVVLVTDEIRKEPNNPNLYIKRALLYRDRKLFDLALNDAEKALSVDSTVSYFHQVKGEVYFASGALRPARLSLEKALVFDESNADLLLKLGEVEFLLRRYEDALTHINEALRVNDKAAQGYFLKGFIYKELGDTVLSKSSFQTATEVNPDHYEAYVELATLYAYQKDSLALQYYDNAIDLKPKSAEALYGKGLFQQNRGKFDDALAIYRSLLKADPDNFLGFFNTGYIYLIEFAEFDSARMYFDSVLMVQPNMLDAMYNKGLTYEMEGEFSTAKEYYQDVLQIDAQNDNAARGLMRLE